MDATQDRAAIVGVTVSVYLDGRFLSENHHALGSFWSWTAPVATDGVISYHIKPIYEKATR